MEEKIKVLIVDDSALIRKTIHLLFNEDPNVEIIDEASDPFEAVKKIQKSKPDVLLLDIQMPRMDGLTFLKNLMSKSPIPVIIFSAFVEEGSENAIKAFEYGAVDIIEKPKLSTPAEFNKYKGKLFSALKTAKHANITTISAIDKMAVKSPDVRHEILDNFFCNTENPNHIIAIGASTGGTEAIKWLLQGIPECFPPIVIVQHMPAGFTNSFAKRLNNLSKITVKEAESSEVLKNGYAYIARGDRHLTLKKNENSFKVILEDSAPVNRHKPSVDVLFESVAKNFNENAIGILLTGMGNDGAEGLKKIKESGAYTIAQDENTSVIFGMPKAAILMGVVDNILPIYKITESLIKIIENKVSDNI